MKAILIILLLLSVASAWDWDTHRWFAVQICNSFNCGCYEEIKNGSITPDRDFKDFSFHSCYSYTCEEGEFWDCPVRKDCPAMEKAKEWLLRATSSSGCERWYAIGVASHYWLDSKCFWHQVQREDYERCHKPFEDEVGEKFYKNQKNWTICKCNVCISYSSFKDWLEEFKLEISKLETPKTPPQTTYITPSTPVFKTPEKTPSQTLKTPGFELILAIIALSTIAWRKA